MKIEVRYFGMIAEQIGKDSETIELDFDGNLDLKRYFEDLYPSIARIKFKIAIDQEFGEVLEQNHQASEIALLPPFAGG